MCFPSLCIELLFEGAWTTKLRLEKVVHLSPQGRISIVLSLKLKLKLVSHLLGLTQVPLESLTERLLFSALALAFANLGNDCLQLSLEGELQCSLRGLRIMASVVT